jgi:GTPase Era involved in 16S rRNA processing
VTAEARHWADCVLWDVPGIDGDDGHADTGELERVAREKVAAADIVFLCFDSTSQEARSFEKISAWIASYRKPAIAVLNVRHPFWRFAAGARYPQAHLDYCPTVTDHAGRIRDQLGRIGLHGVPLVAMNTLYAAYARASLPFEGPFPQARDKRLEHAGGPATLLAWSNLPALEELVVAAIETDATALRLGSLIQEAGGVLALADERLEDEVRSPLLAQAEQLERGIAQLLGLLGTPETVLGGRPEFWHTLYAISRLEMDRGVFDVPPVSRAAQYAQSLIAAAFRPLRAEAHRRADAVVDRAMAKRRLVSDTEFATEVFGGDAGQIAAAAIAVQTQLVAYINERITATVNDVTADLRALELGRARIAGNAGKSLRWVSVGARLGGATSSVAAGVMVLNWWNPVGWAAGTVMITGATLSAAGGGIGWVAGRRATGRREAALATARTDARRAVDETFERAERQTAEDAAAIIRTAFMTAVDPAVRDALELREAAAAAASRQEALRTARQRLPAVAADPAAALRTAAARCESRTAAAAGVPRADAPAYLWLGESQRGDRGLAAAAASRPRGHDPETMPPTGRPRHRVRALAGSPLEIPRPGAGRDWLAEARQRLAGDPAAARTLSELDALAAAPPRVLLVGGYNAGKSSFIRRLLVESGHEVPATLQTGDTPTTRFAEPYPWEGISLVDTPGFESGQPEHELRARAQIPDAAAVIFLVSQHLGGVAELRRIVLGDPGQGLTAKADRTVIVLNRCDEIGPDPGLAPEEHAQACDRKRAEVARALGGAVEAEQIICAAAAPYRHAGGIPAEFDPYRSWDGFDDVIAVIDGLRPGLIATGTDASVLHGGIARLHDLAISGEQRSRDLAEQSIQLGRVLDEGKEGLRMGRLLADTSIERLSDRIGDYLERELSEALHSSDAERRRVIVKRLESWPTAAETGSIAAEWLAEVSEKIDAWETQLDQALRRRMASTAFTRAFSGDVAPVPLGFLRRGTRTGQKTLVREGQKVGGALVGLEKTAVADLWFRLGQVPSDEALRLVTTWAVRLGGALQIVSGVISIALLVEDFRLGRWNDVQLREAGQQLRAQAAAWARQVALGTEDEPGLLGLLILRCDELEEDITELGRRRDELGRATTAASEQAAVYDALITAARTRLRPFQEEP